METGGTVVVFIKELGIPMAVLAFVGLAAWRSAPVIKTFFDRLIDQLVSMTATLSTLSKDTTEHHAVTMTKLDGLHEHVDAKLETLEANMRENGLIVAERVGRDVRETGQHVAFTAREAIEIVARQPSNPDFQAISLDRDSPTPSGVARPALPGRVTRPSQPGKEQPTPPWEHGERTKS